MLISGVALKEVGDALKQLSEIKDSLDIDVKQNFIDPLQQLYDKDIKEVLVRKGYVPCSTTDSCCHLLAVGISKKIRQAWLENDSRKKYDNKMTATMCCVTGVPIQSLQACCCIYNLHFFIAYLEYNLWVCI